MERHSITRSAGGPSSSVRTLDHQHSMLTDVDTYLVGSCSSSEPTFKFLDGALLIPVTLCDEQLDVYTSTMYS